MKFLKRDGGGRWGRGSTFNETNLQLLAEFLSAYSLRMAGTVSKSASGKRLRDGV